MGGVLELLCICPYVQVLSEQYLLNCWAFCNQFWYGGTSECYTKQLGCCYHFCYYLRLSVVLHVSAFICGEEIGWIWCRYFVTVSVVCSWLSSLYRRLTIIDAGKIVVTATAGIELHGIPHPP